MLRRDFDSFCCMEETMGVAKKFRDELGASKTSACFLQDVGELLQVPQKRTARSVLGSANFSFKWHRWYIRLGVILCHKLVSVTSREDRFVQDWMLTQSAGVWSFLITCASAMLAAVGP